MNTIANMLKETGKLLGKINPGLRRAVVPWIIRHPRYINAFGKMLRSFRECEAARKNYAENGTVVPPVMILSITSNCNLRCPGCLAAAAGNIKQPHAAKEPDLTHDQWRSIILQGNRLGVFCYIIAGGEPFMYSRLIDLIEEFDDRLFVVFTNGTTVKEADHTRLKRLANAVIVFSVEGSERVTDDRRGRQVFERVMKTMNRMNDQGILTGISVNVNRANVYEWMAPDFLDSIIQMGVRLIFLIEHIPTHPSLSEVETPLNESILTPEERAAFRAKVLEYKQTKPVFLLHSPGDEEHLGGCVSAGRGFAHVTPSGDVTPCPVSNVATHNLTNAPLEDAFRSPLFSEIRENERLLETEGMPCALFAHPKEVDELAQKVGAYRVGEGTGLKSS